MAALIAPTDDMEMEKIAEDELSKLQRQFRVMEIDRATVLSSVQPTLRMQKNIINTLNADLEKIMLELKFTKSTSNLMEGAKSREKLIALLKDHEKYSSEVKDHRETIKELNFLLKQVQKEIKSLRSKVMGTEIAYSNVLTGQTLISQLENRLDTAMKKFNTVNSENYSMRLEIDRLLRDRQFFNTHWKNQLKRLMDGKAMIIELLEQAISTYDQREEWCSKLDALKEKAATDYRKHCLEVRELQRQLDHSMKLEEFLRTKGTVRLTAADAKAEAKKLEQQEEEMRIYNNYVNILDALKEFAGEDDVDKLIQEFTRREEENYALFNYINEVCTELKNLSDNVKMLRANIEEETAKHQAKLFQQQDSIESLRSTLEEKRQATADARAICERSSQVLTTLLQQIHALALTSECDSLPLLKLLGKPFDINVTNARLYIKSLEKKVLEIIEIIRIDEVRSTVNFILKEIWLNFEWLCKFDPASDRVEGAYSTVDSTSPRPSCAACPA
uniref:SFRICE_004761 n=1 Tax=Spodoptera frugiperda TaxID=7108 RepID=A0A2H1W5G8_SPOFR